MFCNKPTVNLLTGSLLAFGIEDAVVCPGSRNAVIVHNLNECARLEGTTMRLHPVTDERSAAFVAIGIWLKTRRPVVVCVTSGSALLNLLPGVAEAYYRNIPLVIVSADRPAEWIGQLDGQTLPQPNALLPYAKCWNLEKMETAEKLCVQALRATASKGGRPVHINVPLSEPLFDFSVSKLPAVVVDSRTEQSDDKVAVEMGHLQEILRSAQHPALIIGQWEDAPIPAVRTLLEAGWTVFAENISNQGIYNDTLPTLAPDLLVHIGGTLVEKRLKLQLRALTGLTVVRIDETDDCPATFGHVEYKVKAHPALALQHIVTLLRPSATHRSATGKAAELIIPEEGERPAAFFVGNSTAVRWANRNLRLSVPTYCNRGVNGIEGSLSVAAGYALATDERVLCLIGDLSFFYDVNALWNQRLQGNLRILLINNNKGGIFYRLPGLDDSPALDDYIAAHHTTGAQGIAQSYGCTYLAATLPEEEHTGYPSVRDIMPCLKQLLNIQSDKPVIYEISLS